MDKEMRTKRMIELLNKDDFNCDDYEELKGLLAEDEKRILSFKRKIQRSSVWYEINVGGNSGVNFILLGVIFSVLGNKK